MHKILVSACLLGHKVRYDGLAKESGLLSIPLWQSLQQQGRLVVICPECAGGLPVPRPPAELQSDGRVVTVTGLDVSAEFNRGAQLALEAAKKSGARVAILKANSPSCGNEQIYDGSFQGCLTSGMGVTAQLLTEAGIKVFNEFQLELAQHYLQQLELESPAGSASA